MNVLSTSTVLGLNRQKQRALEVSPRTRGMVAARKESTTRRSPIAPSAPISDDSPPLFFAC